MKLPATLLLCTFAAGCATMEPKPRVTRAQAEHTALARVHHGTIREGELEKENGRLVWSFDIARPGTKNIREIQVDANSGAIVAEETETPSDEQREKSEEKRKK